MTVDRHARHGYARILAATDFSPSAEAAVRQAAWAAQRFGARLVLTHVLPDFVQALYEASDEARHQAFHGDPEVLQREIRHKSDERLKKTIADLGLANLNASYETLIGQPFVKIIQAVQAEGYDLVVVGTRGLSAWKQFVLGSTAKRLIRMCPSSVWVVKGESKPPPRSILVATDFSDVSDRAFEHAQWLAGVSGGELHVLHVLEEEIAHPVFEIPFPPRQHQEDEAQERLKALTSSAAATTAPVQTHLAWGTPWLEIVQHAQRLGTDLLVLGSVGRSGIKGLLLGNTANRVLENCDCNLLTVKPAGFVSPIEPAFLPLHPG
jgi:nucleotide-binding universal stress UspA family protein